MERQILRALLVRKVEEKIVGFVDEHAENVRELEMNPEEVKSLVWELLGEAVEQHKKD